MPRTEMDAVDIAEFLHEQQAGVLSLADDDEAYGIPVSFEYVEDEEALYFRFGYAGESQKRRFVDATRTATFVVYDRSHDGWKSVVAEGRLTVLSEDTVESSVMEAVQQLDIPYFEVHETDPADLEFSLVRLDASKLSGIAEGFNPANR